LPQADGQGGTFLSFSHLYPIPNHFYGMIHLLQVFCYTPKPYKPTIKQMPTVLGCLLIYKKTLSHGSQKEYTIWEVWTSLYYLNKPSFLFVDAQLLIGAA
jgi:hypothetical protein